MLHRLRCGKKKINRQPEREEDAAEDSETEDDAVTLPRLRILATRMLGYTHTEYGMRKMHQIVAELAEAAMSRSAVPDDENEIIDGEAI